MRLVSVQPEMAGDVEANVRTITRAAHGAVRGQQAQAVLFPECAVTGFHRGLASICTREALHAAMEVLQGCAGSLGVTMFVGTPWFRGADIQNTLAVIRPGEPPIFAPKLGLTEAERRFFTAGDVRPVWTTCGLRCSAVICREMLDVDSVVAGLKGRVDLVLWPGYIAWDGGSDPYDEAVRAVARGTGATVVQCNWPQSLNRPDTRSMGGSLAVSAAGETLKRAASDAPDTLVLSLSVPSGS